MGRSTERAHLAPWTSADSVTATNDSKPAGFLRYVVARRHDGWRQSESRRPLDAQRGADLPERGPLALRKNWRARRTSTAIGRNEKHLRRANAGIVRSWGRVRPSESVEVQVGRSWPMIRSLTVWRPTAGTVCRASNRGSRAGIISINFTNTFVFPSAAGAGPDQAPRRPGPAVGVVEWTVGIRQIYH